MADKNASLSNFDRNGKLILQLSRTAIDQLLAGLSIDYPAQKGVDKDYPAVSVALRFDQLKKAGYVA